MNKIELSPINITDVEKVVSEGYSARRKLYDELKDVVSAEDAQGASATLNNIRHIENALRDVDYAVQRFNSAVGLSLEVIERSLGKREKTLTDMIQEGARN